ncbi:unnamed protein product, partial [marine sediment metagenome]
GTDYAPTIAYSTFAENSVGIVLYAYSGNITSSIHDNTFTANYQGLQAYGGGGSICALPILSNNAFNDHTDYPIVLSEAFPTYSGNSFSNNAHSAIALSGSFSCNGTWHQVSTFPYVAITDISVPSGATVTLPPGLVVKFLYSVDLAVYGTLDLQGTSGSPVVFTSFNDDTGGDTNNNSTSPGPNDWGSILLYNSNTTFDYAIVKYASTGLFVRNDSGTDYAPTIAYSTFAENSVGIVLYAYSGNITSSIHDNTFTANNYGLTANGGSGYALPTVSDNDIFGNTEYGLYNGTSSQTVIAEGNWWGDVSGPKHPTVNPGGQGNAVSDDVDFVPWLPSPNFPPALQVIPTVLDFGTITTELTFDIRNSGGGALNWTIEEQTTWLGAQSASGDTGGDGIYTGSGYETVAAVAGRLGLRETVHNTVITVTSNGGNVVLPVSIIVGPLPGSLSLIAASAFDVSHSLAGFAQVDNPQTSGYEFYR